MNISPFASSRIRYFLVLAMSVSMLILTASSSCAAADKDNQEVERLLYLFGEVFDKVRGEYVEETSDKELIENAINGMLTSLDPHSSYLNAEDFNEMRIQTSGEFGGLGIEVTMRNSMVYVVSPIDDTPAYKAGLQAGDYISKIDGNSVIGMSLKDAVAKMRGKPGSDIVLTIIRDGEEKPLDVTITRDVITIRSVRSKMIDNVGYIRITSFSEKTAEGLEKAIKALRKEAGGDMLGIVLDLRNNPGGLLDQAIAVSDAFLERGEIVSTRGRRKEDSQRWNAGRGDELDGQRMVVLINGASASASEIVAGALKDHHRAVVMGVRSFGKGSVQTIMPLSEDSAMRLTTSRYYTPSGVSIQAKGIEPDIIVEQAEVKFKSMSRTSEADLSGHLENEEGEEDNKKSEDRVLSVQELYTEDYQLARAVDFLKALAVLDDNK